MSRYDPAYSVWSDMIQRCTNPKRAGYKYYGGRGITVCDRWRHSFTAFLEDVGPRPPGYSIERIDNNGNYTPENCRWIPAWMQQRNARNAGISRNKGEAHGQARHTDEQVQQVVDEYKAGGVTQQELAEKYGVAKSSISRWVNGVSRG